MGRINIDARKPEATAHATEWDEMRGCTEYGDREGREKLADKYITDRLPSEANRRSILYPKLL